ncbi:MAG: hypothetical protein ACOYW9_05155 [Deinococcota bacterium]
MIDNVPRPSVDEPLVASRIVFSPHKWGCKPKPKLVASRIDNLNRLCYTATKPKNPTRRQAERGLSVRLEVFSLLYGILADDELIELVMNAARAANVSDTKNLRAELELRLAEYRQLEQYGSLDEWDCDSS